MYILIILHCHEFMIYVVSKHYCLALCHIYFIVLLALLSHGDADTSFLEQINVNILMNIVKNGRYASLSLTAITWSSTVGDEGSR